MIVLASLTSLVPPLVAFVQFAADASPGDALLALTLLGAYGLTTVGVTVALLGRWLP